MSSLVSPTTFVIDQKPERCTDILCRQKWDVVKCGTSSGSVLFATIKKINLQEKYNFILKF